MMAYLKQAHFLAITGIVFLCVAASASARSPFTEDAMDVIDASVTPCGVAKISPLTPDRTAASAEIDACTKLIDAPPPHARQLDRASALDERARTYIIIGDVQKGLADSNAAVALDPSSSDHYHMRIWIDLFLKRFNDLIGDTNRGLKDFKGDPMLMAYRAWAYIYVRNYPAAVNHFSALLVSNPNIPGFHNGRCEALALAGQEQEALEECTLALRLRYNGKNLSDTLGYVFLRLRRWQDAVIQYGQVLRMEPGAAKALYGRGLAKYRMGEVAEAGGAADIAAAKRIDPQIEADFARDP